MDPQLQKICGIIHLPKPNWLQHVRRVPHNISRGTRGQMRIQRGMAMFRVNVARDIIITMAHALHVPMVGHQPRARRK